jgi:hypothetical protein
MMTDLNPSDAAGAADRAVAERLAALPPLPRDQGGPMFSEPWQAQAFALAVKLSEQGLFNAKGKASAKRQVETRRAALEMEGQARPQAPLTLWCGNCEHAERLCVV